MLVRFKKGLGPELAYTQFWAFNEKILKYEKILAVLMTAGPLLIYSLIHAIESSEFYGEFTAQISHLMPLRTG